MIPCLRLSLSIGVLATVAGAVFCVCRVATQGELTLGGLLPDPGRVLQERRRRHDLDYMLKAVSQRIEGKNTLLALLKGGRVRLLEAAAGFHVLNHRDPPFHWDSYRLHYAGITDEERHCREVIESARGLCESNAESQEWVQQLERELSQHLANGTLAFPAQASLPPLPLPLPREAWSYPELAHQSR
jgi:hypothetical protein